MCYFLCTILIVLVPCELEECTGNLLSKLKDPVTIKIN